MVGGIADYAGRFRMALEAASIEFDDLVPEPGLPSRAQVREIHKEVHRWAASGGLSRYRLAHVELATFSTREFHYARALSRAGVLLVLTLHETRDILFSPYHHLGPRLVSKVLDLTLGRAAKSALLRSSDLLVTLGPSGSADLQHRWSQGSERCPTIPHVSYKVKDRRPSAGPVRILSLGFFGPHKGFEVLLAAYARLLRDRPDLIHTTRLVLTGADYRDLKPRGLNSALEGSGIPEASLVRLGFVSEEELQDLLAEGHIAVIPYDREFPGSTSGILMRALSAGIACVVSDNPALTQHVSDGVTASVFPAGNDIALALCIETLVEDQSMRDRLGAAAQRQVADCCNPREVGDRVTALYASVDARRSP